MKKKVIMLGSWHLGSVIGACLAEAGNEVYLWDQNDAITDKWRKGKSPIHEPGLDELVQLYWNKNLFWAPRPGEVVRNADVIALTYDTPINDKDEVQLAAVEEGFELALKEGFRDDVVFFFTSQIPVGTSRRLKERILELSPKWKGNVLYQPENLRLGDAIRSFQSPDRMVLGVDSNDPNERSRLADSFRKLLSNTQTPMQVMSLESAEMVKHAMNSFLATCVVFANELSEVCEKTGADAWDVAASLKTDSRVGPKAFLRPGLGFAGGTLARDVKTLSKMLEKNEGKNFFSRLYEINLERNEWVYRGLKEELGSLESKKILLLGVTYKPQTSTVRRSPAIEIAALLRADGALCVALDPKADLSELTSEERASLPFQMETDPQRAFDGADAVVLITEWPQFQELDLAQLGSVASRRFLIDTKYFLVEKAKKAGFKAIVPGKP